MLIIRMCKKYKSRLSEITISYRTVFRRKDWQLRYLFRFVWVVRIFLWVVVNVVSVVVVAAFLSNKFKDDLKVDFRKVIISSQQSGNRFLSQPNKKLTSKLNESSSLLLETKPMLLCQLVRFRQRIGDLELARLICLQKTMLLLRYTFTD